MLYFCCFVRKCTNLFYRFELACQKRHWTLISEYQRHRWWWRWWNSSSCCGTETRTHKECKFPALCKLDSIMIMFFGFPLKICFSYFTFSYISSDLFIIFDRLLLLFRCVAQVYTRSVIDPIPAPSTCTDGDAASRAADRQKKKGKMSDEEIMDKLSKSHLYNKSIVATIQQIKSFYTFDCYLLYRNYSQHWRSQEEVHEIWKNWPGVSADASAAYTICDKI